MNRWISDGRARVVAAEDDQFFVPFGWKYDQSHRAIIWCHGAGGTYAVGPVEAAIAEVLGCVWINATLGGARTWGSDASLTHVTTAWTTAKNTFNVKPDKLVLWGGSMGGLTATLYALANPSNVAAVGCAIPGIDPEYVRLNDPGSPANVNKDAIEALYGANEVPAAKQAYSRGADWTSTVPIDIWYSTNDTFTPSASITTFDTAAGAACTLHSLGAAGHNYLDLPTAEAMSYLSAYVR